MSSPSLEAGAPTWKGTEGSSGHGRSLGQTVSGGLLEVWVPTWTEQLSREGSHSAGLKSSLSLFHIYSKCFLTKVFLSLSICF